MDALTCSLAALLLATAVGPGHQLPVVVQDDALLLNRAPAQVQQYAEQIAAEGASDVPLTASWSGLAPSPTATKKPAAPFDASDAKPYPVDGFGRLDTAVKAAAASGLDAELDLAFWLRAGPCRRPRTATTASVTCPSRPSSGCSRRRWRAATRAPSPTHRCDRGVPSPCALRRQRDLPHERSPGGRQLRAERRDPGQPVAAT